ncbi:glycosyltransferase [Klebsiella pneumoniae]|nr:glycosyltransferase [Klebsiella pneumoniae]
MHPDVFAIIVTYNPDDGLEGRLLAIQKQVRNICIIDNSENPDVINNIKSIAERNNLSYQGDGINHGIAYSLTQGAITAKSKGFNYYLTFDQDSTIPDLYVDNMKEAINTDPMIGIIGPVYYDINDGRYSRFPVMHNKLLVRREVFSDNEGIKDAMCIITSGALCRTSIFDEVGYFLNEYFIDYVDNEFCLRLLISGYRVCVYPKVVIQHALGNRKKKFGFSPTNYPYYRKYYVTRNRLHVWKKYFKYYPAFIAYDFSAFLLDLFRVVFLEKDKFIKIKSIFLGVKDFLHGRYGR